MPSTETRQTISIFRPTELFLSCRHCDIQIRVTTNHMEDAEVLELVGRMAGELGAHDFRPLVQPPGIGSVVGAVAPAGGIV